MSKNKEQVIAKCNQAAEEITFKVGEIVCKLINKTARNDKTKPVFKGPLIIHLHPNNISEIIGITLTLNPLEYISNFYDNPIFQDHLLRIPLVPSKI